MVAGSGNGELDEALTFLLGVLDYLGGLRRRQSPAQPGRLVRLGKFAVQEQDGFAQGQPVVRDVSGFIRIDGHPKRMRHHRG